jgi:valyl-tRNA synthetase
VPFRKVVITPLVFDAAGRKMSKSLGNAIDPMDLIEKYGADAVRFGIVRQMRLESQELSFDERFCEKARDFNNKLWNALRYVRGLPEGVPRASTIPSVGLGLADRWILARLRRTIVAVSEALDTFAFGIAADELMDFVWYEFCDWYLEATKAPTPTRAAVLSYVLNAAVRLLHPIAPFVSEEIWQALPHDGATIVTASWPDASEIVADPIAAERYEAVRAVVRKAREMRAELNLAPREKLTLEVPPELEEEIRTLLVLHVGATLAELPSAGGADPLTAVRVRAPLDILAGRYRRELERLDGEVARLEKKLGNEQFTSKASPEVVAKERDKLSGYQSERERVLSSLAALHAEERG